jgi:hypothetical protein
MLQLAIGSVIRRKLEKHSLAIENLRAVLNSTTGEFVEEYRVDPPEYVVKFDARH